MPRERISLEADKIDISSTQGIGTVKSVDSNIEDRGALDYLSTSLKDNSLFAMFAINQANRDTSMFNSDATFGDAEKNDLIKTHRQHILPEYEDYLKDTKSKDEFFHKLEDISKRTYDKTVFGEQHLVASFMLDVASETTNVPVYLGGLALASASAPITVGALASTFAGRAVLGATGEALMTGVKDYIGQKDQTAIDYAFNIAGGGLVAGVFKNNALMIDSSKKAMNRYLDYDNLQNKLSMQPKEKHSEIVKEHLNNISTDNFKNVDELMGKMKQWTDEGKLDPKLWEKFRVDTAYMMKGTESDTLTNISKQLFKDSTLQGNDVDTKYGVELGTMIEDSIISKHSDVSRPITLELAQTAFGQGAVTSRFGDAQNVVDSLMGDLQMNKQLFSTREDFVLDDMLDSVAFRLSKQTNIPIEVAKGIVLKANKASEEVFTFAHDRLASVKKKEFVGDSTVKKNPNYMPIIYDRNMAQKLGDKFVDFNIFKKFLTESMQSKIFKGAKLTAEEEIQLKSIIDVTAQKIWKNKDSDIVEGKSFDDILINTMVENGMTNEAIENLFKATGYADGSASKQNAVFARTRSPFDYSHKMEYVANGQRQTLSFMDLVDTNMGNVVNKYARKMGGNTALEKTKVLRDSTDILDRVNNTVKSIMEITQRKTGIDLGSNAEMSLDQVNDYLKKAGELPKDTVKRIDDTIKELADELEVDLPTAKEIMRVYGENKLLQKQLDDLGNKGIFPYAHPQHQINNSMDLDELKTNLKIASENGDYDAISADFKDIDFSNMSKEDISNFAKNEINKISDFEKKEIEYFFDGSTVDFKALEKSKFFDRYQVEKKTYEPMESLRDMILDGSNQKNHRDILQHIIDNSKDKDIVEYANNLMSISKMLKGNESLRISKHIDESMAKSAKAYYSSGTNSISFTDAKYMDDPVLYLHELTHGLSARALSNMDTASRLYPESKNGKLYADVLNNIDKILDSIKRDVNYANIKGMNTSYKPEEGGTFYGFTDRDEFLAEFMTNKHFRELLKNVYPDGKQKNDLYTKITNALKRAFGLPETFNKNAFDIINTKKDVIFAKNKYNPTEMYDNVNMSAKPVGNVASEIKSAIEENNKFIEQHTKREISLDNDINIAKVREQIHRELAESNMSKSQADSALTRFDEIINELKGNPTASDPFGSMAQTERIISNMNIFRLLGQTGWTMSAEMASVAFEGGVKNFLNNSSMGALIKQFKTGKIDDKLAQEIQTWTGLGDQLNRAIGVNKYDHNYAVDSLPSNGQKVEKWLGKAEGVSEKLSEATLLFGGVKPLSAWLEMTYAKSMISQIIQMGTQKNPLSSNQIKQLQEMGFSSEMADKIFTQMKTHGNFAEKSWSNSHKVLELNFDKWDDDVRDMFIVGLRRKSHTVIQKSDMGDKFGATLENKMMKNTLIGRIALQLKDYMITSYAKQFGRAMNRKDAYMIGLASTQLFALTMSDILQNITNYAGNQDELEEKLEFQAIADRVLHKMPQSSYIPMGVDMASMAVMNKPLVGEDRYGSSAQSAFMALPAIDFAIKLGKITGMPEHLISDGKLHNQDIDAISSLTGLNTYGTRTLKEMIKAENE